MAEYIDKEELMEQYPEFDGLTFADVTTIDIVHCKDCKWWKDSDGVYRRGYNAESKCRVNCKEVMRGDWFCADGERREDEYTSA